MLPKPSGSLNTKAANMNKITSVIARGDDGGVQITFTIPYEEIKKAHDDTAVELAKDIEVPGFRKGKAPVEQARKKIPQTSLIEHSLSHILPKALADAVTENKLKLALYPKYELIKAEERKDWEVVARTCELPEIALGDYKTIITNVLREESHSAKASRDEKEQMVIKALIENIKITIPKILVDEEVNSRLASLLSKIEKLGLALESYLSSIGKNPETIRTEYETQAKEAIALDLILSKVGEDQNISISDKEIEEAIKVAEAKPESKRLVEAVLKKRKALEFLSNLS